MRKGITLWLTLILAVLLSFTAAAAETETAEYEDRCKTVMELYAIYIKLTNAIRSEQNKNSKGLKNIEKIIARIYDSENEANINTNVLPVLMEKVDAAIPQDNAAMREIKSRMNTFKWQLC